MQKIETDYPVVGAGACGMAFADMMVTQSQADMVIVDRRHGRVAIGATPIRSSGYTSPRRSMGSTR